MVGVGIIGYGYWGPNLVRNFFETKGASIRHVCDLRVGRLEHAAMRFPGVRTTTSVDELIDDPAVDAVAIATPVSTHFDFAMRALAAGKHVLVEKPLAGTAEAARRLGDRHESCGAPAGEHRVPDAVLFGRDDRAHARQLVGPRESTAHVD